MTLMLALLTACGPTSESTADYTTTTPHIAIQNDASDVITVSILAADGTLEVWFDDVAPGTSTELTAFDADLVAAEITVHAGPALPGIVDLDHGNNVVILTDDAEPSVQVTENGSGGSGNDPGDDGDDGGGWGW